MKFSAKHSPDVPFPLVHYCFYWSILNTYLQSMSHLWKTCGWTTFCKWCLSDSSTSENQLKVYLMKWEKTTCFLLKKLSVSMNYVTRVYKNYFLIIIFCCSWFCAERSQRERGGGTTTSSAPWRARSRPETVAQILRHRQQSDEREFECDQSYYDGSAWPVACFLRVISRILLDNVSGHSTIYPTFYCWIKPFNGY